MDEIAQKRPLESKIFQRFKNILFKDIQKYSVSKIFYFKHDVGPL